MISESDYKIYYIMFALTIETVYLMTIWMMMMMMMMMTGDISTFDMQATDDKVAEIFRKHVTW